MKVITTIFTLALCIFYSALKAQDNFYFSGSIQNRNSDSIVIIQYYPTTFHRFDLGEEGNFADSLFVEEGFYWLSDGEETTEIYLAPNHTLKLSLDAKLFDESLYFAGSLANENNYKAQKVLWLESIGDYAMYGVYAVKSEVDFLYYTDSLYQERIDHLQKDTSITEQFRSLAEKDDELNYKRALDNYEMMHRYYTKNDAFRKSDTFPSVFNDLDFDNPIWINLSSYRNALVQIFNQQVRDIGLKEGQDWSLECVKIMEKNLKDKKVRNVMAINIADRLTSSKKVDSVYLYLEKMLCDEASAEFVLNAYRKVSKTAKGNPSPKFSFKGIDDKKVKLDDFKGKFVYIDIWATWCAPCINEIPHLKKVTEQFKDKDIAFISICQDDTHERWIKTLEAKNLGGVQLYAENKEDSFFTDYSLNGIPRFILLDRNGVIISPNAKRPSNPELISELEDLLEE